MKYRSFKGYFTSRENFSRELKERGLTIEEYDIIYDRERKVRKNIGIKPSMDKAFKEVLTEYVETRENGFDFEENAKDFIKMLSNYQRNKGKAFYNGKKISKNQLVSLLQDHEKGLAAFYPKITIKQGDFYYSMNETELENNKEQGGSHNDKNGNHYVVSS